MRVKKFAHIKTKGLCVKKKGVNMENKEMRVRKLKSCVLKTC